MIELSLFSCRHIAGGSFQTTTSTELSTSNKHIRCTCVCIDQAEQTFIDDSDDTWLWWVIIKPYRVVASWFQ